VVGHTDNIGDPSYNQTLSEKRASTVSQIFIETGFKTQNIQSMGRGASQPLVENSSEENRALNRRVNIIIIIIVLCFILSLRHEGFFIYCTKLQA
jgi:outer membrane protein OmpA-like peptidoglycan-associated protein